MNHDARSRIVSAIVTAFAEHIIHPPTEDLESFVREVLPWVAWRDLAERLMQSLSQPWSTARLVFDLGRQYERTKLDALTQAAVDAVDLALSEDRS